MNSIENFVQDKLLEQLPDAPSVPISFRGSEITVMQADILANILGYSTRSKLLSELVPAALDQAIKSLPKELIQSYNDQLTKSLESKGSKGAKK